MNDLIYANYEAEKIVEKKYPNIKIEDASDEIHQERFEIQFNEDEYNEHEYLKFLLESGLFQVSLRFQVMSKTKEDIPKISKALEELRKEKPGLFKNSEAYAFELEEKHERENE